MGYGEFGGNGSVHWRIGHEGAKKGELPKEHKRGKGHYYSADPIANDEVGLSKGAPSGHLRLEVMYEYPADAQAALQSITVQGSSLVLFIKANTATPPKGVDVPAQVRVSW